METRCPRCSSTRKVFEDGVRKCPDCLWEFDETQRRELKPIADELGISRLRLHRMIERAQIHWPPLPGETYLVRNLLSQGGQHYCFRYLAGTWVPIAVECLLGSMDASPLTRQAINKRARREGVGSFIGNQRFYPSSLVEARHPEAWPTLNSSP